MLRGAPRTKMNITDTIANLKSAMEREYWQCVNLLHTCKKNSILEQVFPEYQKFDIHLVQSHAFVRENESLDLEDLYYVESKMFDPELNSFIDVNLNKLTFFAFNDWDLPIALYERRSHKIELVYLVDRDAKFCWHISPGTLENFKDGLKENFRMRSKLA